jgi:SAM-dependent methyltransferase
VPQPDGTLPVEILRLSDDAATCPACGARYPRVDGVVCVPPDPAALVGQAQAFEPGWLADPHDPAAVATACARAALSKPGTDAFTEEVLPAIYTAAHYFEGVSQPRIAAAVSDNRHLLARVGSWLERHLPVPAPSGCALEAGCGPGGLLATLGAGLGGAVGFDVRVSMLRIAARMSREGCVELPLRSEGRRFEPLRVTRAPAATPVHLVQGDLVAPPFEAESFALVAALSLLDTVPDPVFALGQLDALTAPGGLLLLGCPYHWEPHVTPPDLWWSDERTTGGQRLRRALSGREEGLEHLSYELLEESEESWTIPGHARVAHRYAIDLVLARKRC